MAKIPQCPRCHSKMERIEKERRFGEPWRCPKCNWTGSRAEIQETKEAPCSP